jgi:hypothetical protein
MTRKIIVIVIWIGRLPSGFPFWLATARKQPFTIAMVTDQPQPEDCKDIIWVPTSLAKLRKQISNVLGFDASLAYSYKVCDYRAIYGLIFSDLVEGYDYWGFCDLDLIFGDMEKVLDNALMESPDKVFQRAHFSLYKNTATVNEAFSKYKEIDYKYIFKNPRYCMFDEWHGIGKIFKKLNLSVYHKEVIADVKPNDYRFRCSNIPNYSSEIFIYQHGKLLKYYVQDATVKTEEYGYLHFQKRKLEFPATIDLNKIYVINADGVRVLDNFKGTISEIRALDVNDYSQFLYRAYKSIKVKSGLEPNIFDHYLAQRN